MDTDLFFPPTRRAPNTVARADCVPAELLLSTPLTVVVNARLEFVDAAGGLDEQDLPLVIARRHCEGDHPLRPALLAAAMEQLQRCPWPVRRLRARVDGEWRTLVSGESLAEGADWRH